MIKDTFEESFSPEWVENNITDRAHELVVLRRIIPWERIVTRLTPFYDEAPGAEGKSLRIMAALLIISRLRGGTGERKPVYSVFLQCSGQRSADFPSSVVPLRSEKTSR